MCLNLGNQAFDRLPARCVSLWVAQLRGCELRRSKPKIKAAGDNGQASSDATAAARRRHAADAASEAGGVGLGSVGCGKQAPGDFHARRLRLGLAN